MSQVDNLIIEHLKALRAEVAAVKADTAEIKQRLISHDNALPDLRRADVHGFEDQARQQLSIDKLAERMQLIEARLELS